MFWLQWARRPGPLMRADNKLTLTMGCYIRYRLATRDTWTSSQTCPADLYTTLFTQTLSMIPFRETHVDTVQQQHTWLSYSECVADLDGDWRHADNTWLPRGAHTAAMTDGGEIVGSGGHGGNGWAYRLQGTPSPPPLPRSRLLSSAGCRANSPTPNSSLPKVPSRDYIFWR